MGWQVYEVNGRDCGYGVPAECDSPKCRKRIDRGLAYLCGVAPGTSQFGCGLYFCTDHVTYRSRRGGGRVRLCSRCYNYRSPYEPKPDVREWVSWKLLDKSWREWREANPGDVVILKAQIA